MSLDSILLLGMGPTWYMCPKNAPENCEIWAINTMYRNHKNIAKLFMMHDIRIEIIMQDKNFIDNVNATGIPIYTPTEYSTLKNNIVYPLKQVIEEFKLGFFLNSVSYMLAYAIMQKPKNLFLYGIDMRPDGGKEWHLNEKGCVECWLGLAMGRGIEVHLPMESSLFKRNMVGNWYGYADREKGDGVLEVIPKQIQKQHKYFKLVPLDGDGKEIPLDAVTVETKDFQGEVVIHKGGLINETDNSGTTFRPAGGHQSVDVASP